VQTRASAWGAIKSRFDPHPALSLAVTPAVLSRVAPALAPTEKGGRMIPPPVAGLKKLK
jgi:hypothetical protein